MIKKKRASLENFLKEQIIGPGASGNRYVDIQDNIIFSEPLSSDRFFGTESEILNVVPGALYSSAILFPINRANIKKVKDSEAIFEDNIDESVGGEEIEVLDQMFPNMMGFTCCMSDEILTKDLIMVEVSARYYKKIDEKAEDYYERYGIVCEFNIKRFKEVVESCEFNNIFTLKTIKNNNVLLMSKQSEVGSKIIRNKLNDYEKSLVKKVNGNKDNTKITYLSSLKNSFFRKLKNEKLNIEDRAHLYNLTQELEEFESVKNHIENLIDISSAKSYGLWKSETVRAEVRIPIIDNPNLKGKQTFLYKDYSSLSDVIKYELSDGKKASLSVNFQVSRDSRKIGSEIFLKTQLINTSTPFYRDNSNRYFSAYNEDVNNRSFFGVKMKIKNQYLQSYNLGKSVSEKSSYTEDDVIKFIYRQFTDYGIGHGCSVSWDKNDKSVETSYLPYCDTPDVDPTPRDKNLVVRRENHFESKSYVESLQTLEFKWLSLFSKVKNNEIIDGLNKFVEQYGLWIDSKTLKYSQESGAFEQIAKQELYKCRKDKDRMLYNIKHFLSGEQNMEQLQSFRLMNSTMFMQLWHSVNLKNNSILDIINDSNFEGFDDEFYRKSSDELFQEGKSASWRAFQLAFILLNLDGIFKLSCDDIWEKRNNWVDLVWFPTGGGKTEAYLGLISLTIINRRRQFGELGGGTAAIMRYTLRLLTLQQFQRATLVIMALELLRRWGKYDLGKEPINIGMWVGNNSLPNKLDDLNKEFLNLQNKQNSKIPFEVCPWCGSNLMGRRTSAEDGCYHSGRYHLICTHSRCSFFKHPVFDESGQGPIPVSLCDEEIYQHPPALLFGTVDKFALLAHKISSEKIEQDSRRLFGKGNWEKGKPSEGYLPPDLIIQDELHLLLGPLGSSVALFESAVDQLCTRIDGTRPKVISSTATTRNTNLQIMALFNRKVDIFPKPGVECDDSFFSYYKREYSDLKGSDEIYLSNRRYLGFLPTGKTQIWMQMRIAALLMTHRAIFEKHERKGQSPLDFKSYESIEKAMDYYHTIVSYFNSLREVGKTESQVQSYIKKELLRVFNRVLRPQYLLHSLYTYEEINKSELTGRLSGEEVKNELSNVEKHWRAENRFLRKRGDGFIKGTIPPDFVVATSMISVGIDVSRFNLIIMNSMPRNIAEYIQASSRVARDSYGLVLTVHHPFRARDVSHYEKFIEFHEKMYSYVEPISITPFTNKSLDRYLGLYLATIIRHKYPKYANRDQAEQIQFEDIKLLTNDLMIYFKNRQNNLQDRNIPMILQNLLKLENLESIRSWIFQALSDWKKLVEEKKSDEKIVFNNASNKINGQINLYVGIDEYEGNNEDSKWKIPMSLRVIEPEAAIKIKQK